MESESIIKRGVCYCPNHCRVQMEVKDSKLMWVGYKKDRSLIKSPTAKRWNTAIGGCGRSSAWKGWLEHSRRLNFPLKRKGERGEDKWTQISWDQAFDEIAEKLEDIRQKYGPEALALANTGESNNTYSIASRARFMNMFGTPNYIGHLQVCFSPALMISHALSGWGIYFPYTRPETKCFLMWGVNPYASWRYIWYSVRDAQKNNGTKLIVVDPRHSEAARAADLWLQPRPGTDAALMLGMINLIIEEGLYDKEFVEKWCYGFDELTERVKEYPLDKVAETTWVPPEKISEAARLYATNKPGIILTGMGVEQQANSTSVFQCRYIMPAIVGNLDVPGGEYMQVPHRGIRPQVDFEMIDALSPVQKKKMIGADKYRLWSWEFYEMTHQACKKVRGIRIPSGWFATSAHAPTVFRAMLTGKPYPVRALISETINTLLCFPNTRLVYQALKSLDLNVVIEVTKNPNCLLADYVLPAASWLEKPILMGGDLDSAVQAGQQAVPAFKEGEFDRKQEYEIYRQLGIRLGQKDYWPWENLEQVFDYALEPLDMTYKEFIKQGSFDPVTLEHKKYEKAGTFGTVTGKFELSSKILEKLGYDPLPQYIESPCSAISQPDLAKGYPLILTTGGRTLRYYHSQWYHIESFKKRDPFPVIQMHPDKARELGIVEGDHVWVETQLGRVNLICKYFHGMDPRVVNANHYGAWDPDRSAAEPSVNGIFELNVNAILDDDPNLCDHIGGGWPLRGQPCKVYKTED